jgi:hypothetical protein
LGADMYYYVYPVQTARFGTAIVPEVGKSYVYLIWQFRSVQPVVDSD